MVWRTALSLLETLDLLLQISAVQQLFGILIRNLEELILINTKHFPVACVVQVLTFHCCCSSSANASLEAAIIFTTVNWKQNRAKQNNL